MKYFNRKETIAGMIAKTSKILEFRFICEFGEEFIDTVDDKMVIGYQNLRMVGGLLISMCTGLSRLPSG
ncbi:MAG: hypothetical protein DRP01_05165 [Archaeoglobales archaeon]|nr:MAG: hypothetical protein DRP01_05165 [Archaeoglobales archaeon]